jgi:hypothetical protein
MPSQNFSSPVVRTREIDQSFLPTGVRGIGAVVVGRTKSGPAFVPMFFEGFDQFEAAMGGVDPTLQAVYLIKNYLKNSTACTVVRVLGHSDGTATTNGYTVSGISGIADSGSNGKILAVVHHSGVAGSSVTVAQVAGDLNNFVFKVAPGGTTLFAATASFLTSSANYIEKVLNTDPTKYSTYGHYLYSVFKYDKPMTNMTASIIAVSGGLNDFTKDFTGGSTSWVTSQPVGGQFFNLFKFHTKIHGRDTNDNFKITIANVRPSPSPQATPYGSFDVFVRKFYDTDQRPEILEQFINCNLDPDSPSYLLNVIGDRYLEFDTATRKPVTHGTYPSRSNLIRVELNTEANYPPEALPWGFRGYDRLAFVSASNITALPYTPNQTDKNGNVDTNIAWGVSFVSGGIVDRMRAFPESATGGLTGSDSDFNMAFLTHSWNSNGKLIYKYNASLVNLQWHQPIYASASYYKFTMPLFGGFDGFDLRVKDPLYLTNVADETDIGVVSLKRALDVVADPDAVDMNLLFTPGIHNLKVTDYARQIANNRGDVMYVMDITGSTVAEAVGGVQARELDDNYTACYYPDLYLNDRINRKIVRVSPSVAVAGALAFSDRVSQVFFAPAGLNRGGLSQFDIIDVTDRLTHADRDELYVNRINPIAVFPIEGISIFGQKTLQVKQSALDRINVRRLLIFAKKTISSAAKYLLFEQNNAATWQRFTNLVNPILEKVRQDQGIERFRVVMDSTTNTNDLIDRNIMTGKIFLQPTKAAEYIDLSFIITNAGVEFGE